MWSDELEACRQFPRQQQRSDLQENLQTADLNRHNRVKTWWMTTPNKREDSEMFAELGSFIICSSTTGGENLRAR